jgi:hypothetical protein
MHRWLARAKKETDIVAPHDLKLLLYVSDAVVVQPAPAHADHAAVVPVLVWSEPSAVGTGLYTDARSAG